MSSSEQDVGSWAEAVANLHASTAHDPGDIRRAYEAMALVWSAYGFQDAPFEVLQLLVNASEVGYLAALSDIRRGRLDGGIEMWRPDVRER